MTLEVDGAMVHRGPFEVRATFSCEQGETLALLGPNGAGKSTMVAALAGLRSLDAGRIRLGSRVLEDADAGIRMPPQHRPIGVVHQDLLLFPHLSALENVAFPLRARGVTRSEARRAASRLLDRLAVGHRARVRPAALSGGEAQRVALARALVHAPSLLLLDEPLSALDVQARQQVRTLLRRELSAFDGVRVLVTHDPIDAMTLADRIVVMEGGGVTHLGSPEEIRSAPRTPYAAELVGINLFRGRLEPLPDGAARLVTPVGAVVVAPAEPPRVGEVAGLLRPSDVSLHLEPPVGSARNAILGRVASVWIEGDRARVRLDAEPPLVAEITRGSVDRLGLHDGTEVWASFKAVEVKIVPI